MKVTTYECSECGYSYSNSYAAAYCAKTDLDPRKENQQLKNGELASRWVPRPVRGDE